MTKKPLCWGLIGASDIAATRIIPAIKRRGDAVAAVQSTTAEWATEFAATHAIGRGVTDVDVICEDASVDAVYISSANQRHASQALAAIAAGKHVLCEKPLATSMADGVEMVEAAKKKNVVFAVNHHLPGAAAHRTLQKSVANGNLGRPLAIRVGHAVMLPPRLQKWRLDDPTGGGIVLDVTIHDISAVQAILGTVATEVTAIGTRQGEWGSDSNSQLPDAVMANLFFGATPVQLHDAFTVEHFPTSLTIIGSEASIHAENVMTQDPIGQLWRTAGTDVSEVDVGERRDLYDVALEQFQAAILGEGEPVVTGTAGLSALATSLAIQESIDSRKLVSVQSKGIQG